MDLLEYAQQLVARGHTTHHSHLQTLKTMINEQPTEIKPIKKIEKEKPHQFQTNPLYYGRWWVSVNWFSNFSHWLLIR